MFLLHIGIMAAIVAMFGVLRQSIPNCRKDISLGLLIGVYSTGQCLLCHSADYIANQPRLTRQAWKAEVTKMKLKYGAPIETNNVDLLVDYLVKNYGKPAPNEPSKK